MLKKVRIYALYQGDTWLTDGTKKELADYLGVKERTISFYISPTHYKRVKKGYIVIFIGEEYEIKL